MIDTPTHKYSKTADELTERILKLIPDNPQILKMTDAWELFKIKDFKIDDLGPSLYQATWALGKAKGIYNKGEG